MVHLHVYYGTHGNGLVKALLRALVAAQYFTMALILSLGSMHIIPTTAVAADKLSLSKAACRT